MIINGSITGTLDTVYVFTATVSPMTATQPIDYIWQARGQPLVTHTAGLSDTVSFAWDTPGIQVITVTARNVGNLVSAIHTITTFTPPDLVIINSVSPRPPQCVLRNSPNLTDRRLELTGEKFSTTEHSLQFRRMADGATSIHFQMEVNWESTMRITVDMDRIKYLLWPDSRMPLTVRVTGAGYVPVSDWSSEFILADDIAACNMEQQLYLPLVLRNE